MLARKNCYNKIHHEVSLKERHLKELEKELEYLDYITIDTSENSSLLEFREKELNEITMALYNELIYQETLNNMLNTRTSDLKSRVMPTQKLKRELIILDSRLLDHISALEKLLEDISDLTAETSFFESSFIEDQSRKDQKINSELDIIKDSRRLEFCLQQEKRRTNIQLKQKNREKQIKYFEKVVMKLQGDQSVKEEILDVENLLEIQENKFEIIQRETNISNVTDMHPYYMYLDEIQSKLKESAENALKRIEILNNERELLSNRLSQLLYNHKDIGTSGEKWKLKEKCKSLVIYINDYDKMIEKQEELIVAFINSISRISIQLGISREIEDFNRENLHE